jgi:acyl-coenzyme A thioesterase PaaI-like protein
MHGGAIALLGDFTGAVAVASLDHPHAIAPRRLWTQIDYLRPVRMTGTSEFTAEVSWRSKRVAIVDGAVTGPGSTTAARIRQASLL